MAVPEAYSALCKEPSEMERAEAEEPPSTTGNGEAKWCFGVFLDEKQGFYEDSCRNM